MAHVITVAQQKGGSGKTTLTVHLACELAARGKRVALIDLDPQGSLGRWFLLRYDREAGLKGDITFTTSSPWGVPLEIRKLSADHDVVLIDTPPKIDSDLRPALKAASLVLVPISASQVDLWATEGVLDLALREGHRPLAVLNRARAGTKGTEAARAGVAAMEVDFARAVLAQRVAYADAVGAGLGVCEQPGARAAAAEVAALADEVEARLA